MFTKRGRGYTCDEQGIVFMKGSLSDREKGKGY